MLKDPRLFSLENPSTPSSRSFSPCVRVCGCTRLSRAAPSPQYVRLLEKKCLWCAYWMGLGILSSVGLGTGLHTFLLYLVSERPDSDSLHKMFRLSYNSSCLLLNWLRNWCSHAAKMINLHAILLNDPSCTCCLRAVYICKN